MREQYKEANDRIHVPGELMSRTIDAVRRQEKKRKITAIWKYAAAAACFCLVCFGAWRFSARDQVLVQDVEISSADMSVGMNLGQHGANGSAGETSGVEITEYDSRDGIPKELWELEPSRLDGNQVYIGRDGNGVWHAAFEKDGKFCYVTGTDMGEKEFLDDLKNIL